MGFSVLRVASGAVLVASFVAACSSSPGKRIPNRDTPDSGTPDGSDGSGGAGPSSGGAGGRNTGGSTSSGGGGVAASSGGTGGAGTGGTTGSGGSTPTADAGDASVGGNSGDAGAGDAGGGFGEPATVTEYGCFSLSGDGKDLLASGEPAVIVTNSPHGTPCSQTRWISDNANAYSPMTPPTTIGFRRSFVLDPSLADGSVRVSLTADDAAEIVLNGQVIGSCTPPGGDPAYCQSSCRSTLLPDDVLRRDGAVNNVEIRLINLQSAAAGNGNYGWTTVSYSLCIVAPS